MLLCLSSGGLGWRVVFEEPPDSAGDVAFDAASDLTVGFAFGGSFLVVEAGWWVASESGHRHLVQCLGELAVSTPVPSPLTRTLTLASMTRLTATRTFMAG